MLKLVLSLFFIFQCTNVYAENAGLTNVQLENISQYLLDAYNVSRKVFAKPEGVASPSAEEIDGLGRRIISLNLKNKNKLAENIVNTYKISFSDQEKDLRFSREIFFKCEKENLMQIYLLSRDNTNSNVSAPMNVVDFEYMKNIKDEAKYKIMKKDLQKYDSFPEMARNCCAVSGCYQKIQDYLITSTFFSSKKNQKNIESANVTFKTPKTQPVQQ